MKPFVDLSYRPQTGQLPVVVAPEAHSSAQSQGLVQVPLLGLWPQEGGFRLFALRFIGSTLDSQSTAWSLRVLELERKVCQQGRQGRVKMWAQVALPPLMSQL